MGRWDPAKKRANHAQVRLRELQRAYPHLPDDILSRATLRQLDQALRRSGWNQSPLPRAGAAGAFAQLESWA
eukprot:15475941-Alexandrium_andersonii.AAC.1